MAEQNMLSLVPGKVLLSVIAPAIIHSYFFHPEKLHCVVIYFHDMDVNY